MHFNKEKDKKEKSQSRNRLPGWRFWAVIGAIVVVIILIIGFFIRRTATDYLGGGSVSNEKGAESSVSNANWWSGINFEKILNILKDTKQKTFTDDFSGNYKLEETGKRADSANPNWWVNSGGWMIVANGTGKTIEGDLDPSDKWFKNYKKNNPEDTDGGAHPQNIFRLVGRDKWQNFSQEVYFKINKMNFSASANRNESNGFLLFNRYQDGDNLYYTGLRVDGYSVIKKKLKGDYHTLSEEKIFPGPAYDRDKNPNLLPVGKWMGIKTEVKTIANGAVQINLYYKDSRDAPDWKLVSDYIDTGQKGAEITSPGYGGIRTDFMDVEFAGYKITEL